MEPSPKVSIASIIFEYFILELFCGCAGILQVIFSYAITSRTHFQGNLKLLIFPPIFDFLFFTLSGLYLTSGLKKPLYLVFPNIKTILIKQNATAKHAIHQQEFL
jgi:hypothetical protein